MTDPNSITHQSTHHHYTTIDTPTTNASTDVGDAIHTTPDVSNDINGITHTTVPINDLPTLSSPTTSVPDIKYDRATATMYDNNTGDIIQDRPYSFSPEPPTVYDNRAVQLHIADIDETGNIALNIQPNEKYNPTPNFVQPPPSYAIVHNDHHIINIDQTDYSSVQVPEMHDTVNMANGVNTLAQYFSTNNLSTVTNDILFTCTMFILMSELIATAVIVGVTYHLPCDSHIVVYVIGFGVRTLLYMPLLIYKRRHPELNDATESLGTVYICNCISYKTVKTIVEVICLIWFIIGNVFFFTSTTCHTTNPILHQTALAWLIISYIGLALPVLLLLTISLCFPFAYMALRILMRIAPQRFTDAIAGVTQADIDKLPVKQYKSDMFDAAHRQCGICLIDYNIDDRLRFLNCKPRSHHFHADCVDDWLKLQGTCPTCRSDIKTGTQRPEQRRVTLPDSLVFGNLLTRPADANVSPQSPAQQQHTTPSNSNGTRSRRGWAAQPYTNEYTAPGSHSYLGANSQPRPYTPSYVGFTQNRRASPHFSGAFDDQLGVISTGTMVEGD